MSVLDLDALLLIALMATVECAAHCMSPCAIRRRKDFRVSVMARASLALMRIFATSAEKNPLAGAISLIPPPPIRMGWNLSEGGMPARAAIWLAPLRGLPASWARASGSARLRGLGACCRIFGLLWSCAILWRRSALAALRGLGASAHRLRLDECNTLTKGKEVVVLKQERGRQETQRCALVPGKVDGRSHLPAIIYYSKSEARLQ